MSRAQRRVAAVAFGLALGYSSAAGPALAQSAGCTALVQAASDALNAQLQFDSQAVKQPTSVRDLSCLDSFFNGTGLNLFASLSDFSGLLGALGGQLCSALKSAWDSEVGNLRCGLTVTGFNLGFGAAGNSFCPALSIGGGGAALFQGGLGNGGSGYYLGTQTQAPTGFQ